MDKQTEMGGIRDQLLLLKAEGEFLHEQALQAQERGDRDAVIALTELHVDLSREATALLTYVTARTRATQGKGIIHAPVE